MSPRLFLPLALAAVCAAGPARADCELLFAPPELRARLQAFHHRNELRREREHTPQAAAQGAESRRPPIDPRLRVQPLPRPPAQG